MIYELLFFGFFSVISEICVRNYGFWRKTGPYGQKISELADW
jgi:hypothetical protein